MFIAQTLNKFLEPAKRTLKYLQADHLASRCMHGAILGVVFAMNGTLAVQRYMVCGAEGLLGRFSISLP